MVTLSMPGIRRGFVGGFLRLPEGRDLTAVSSLGLAVTKFGTTQFFF